MGELIRVQWLDFLLRLDRANSTVRRASCIPFEGFSFTDFKMMGCDVWYDFKKENGFGNVEFIVGDKWAVVVFSGQYNKEGRPLWRVAWAEEMGLSAAKEDQQQRAIAVVQRYMKGSKDYVVSRAESYEVHQRCAAQAIKGRVLLAGDALHVGHTR